MFERRCLYGMIGVGLFLSACQSVDKKSQHSESVRSEQMLDKEFPFPQIPAMLTDPEERKEYLLKHYWDNFDFTDTALVNNRSVSEQGWVNQLALLTDESVSESWITESLENLCEGMERVGQAREVFMAMVDDYLYNPNSPYYNEDLYRIYLTRMLRSPFLEDANKSSLKFRLDLISKNMPGSPAEDFVYYLPDGSRRTLRQTAVKGNRLLLVFYDPECENCHKALLAMESDGRLEAAVASGELTVLAVYTEGNQDVWKNTLSDMPQSWIIGFDREQVKEI